MKNAINGFNFVRDCTFFGLLIFVSLGATLLDVLRDIWEAINGTPEALSSNLVLKMYILHYQKHRLIKHFTICFVLFLLFLRF